MTNQTLTQLSAATSAANNDVMYIVKNYTPGSPTLTGTSHQIAFSALTGSQKKDWIFASVSNATAASTAETSTRFTNVVSSGITLSGNTTFILNPTKRYLVTYKMYYGSFTGGNTDVLIQLENAALTQTYFSGFVFATTYPAGVISPGVIIQTITNTSTLVVRQTTSSGSAQPEIYGKIFIKEQ